MKKFLLFVFLVLLFFCVYFNKDDIITYALRYIFDRPVAFSEKNEYFKYDDYGIVQNTTSTVAENYQDILNIVYSTLNRGLEESSFYCDYDKCSDDVNSIAESSDILANINNMVHPFNSYNKIYFTITNYGKIRIRVNYIYSDSSILLVNSEIDRIVNNNIDPNASTYDKIKGFHDYIINNTSYDSSVSLATQGYISTNASNAMGLLFEKKAICSGYSDTMAIYLNRLGIENYKISSDTHIWNLVKLDGNWLHIDSTWDDPVTNTGENLLLHDFFLISTDTLKQKEVEMNKTEHSFNPNVYKEA